MKIQVLTGKLILQVREYRWYYSHRFPWTWHHLNSECYIAIPKTLKQFLSWIQKHKKEILLQCDNNGPCIVFCKQSKRQFQSWISLSYSTYQKDQTWCHHFSRLKEDLNGYLFDLNDVWKRLFRTSLTRQTTEVFSWWLPIVDRGVC